MDVRKRVDVAMKRLKREPNVPEVDFAGPNVARVTCAGNPTSHDLSLLSPHYDPTTTSLTFIGIQRYLNAL